MTALLEARGVSKVFGGGLFDRRRNVALENFSLAVESEPPSILAVVGESGSGKTTLARLLLGLAAPTSGDVLYKGTSLRALNSPQRRQFLRDVQVIFQDPYEVYNPFYRVDHVLETPITKFGLAGTRTEARAMIESTLRAVGLRPEETLGRFPHQLSGGQRQRIMVARSLLIRPRLIIADEPVSMVDASLRATILGSLRELNREFGISLIYITHDLTTAYQISENIVVLYRGSVAEVGDVEHVVGNPKHPYTQLLVGSVPLPDPDRAWQGEPPPSAEAKIAASAPHPGCAFASRCPSAMPVCRESKPPLYQLDEYRAAACYLYQGSPEVASDELGRVMAPPPVQVV
ncbi:MAG: ABC transporter ATP-binding protein [Chloroflexi bacterium]|nr:ABC transporter ATP-binding protein [Chloroflexota bacterium]